MGGKLHCAKRMGQPESPVDPSAETLGEKQFRFHNCYQILEWLHITKITWGGAMSQTRMHIHIYPRCITWALSFYRIIKKIILCMKQNFAPCVSSQKVLKLQTFSVWGGGVGLEILFYFMRMSGLHSYIYVYVCITWRSRHRTPWNWRNKQLWMATWLQVFCKGIHYLKGWATSPVRVLSLLLVIWHLWHGWPVSIVTLLSDHSQLIRAVSSFREKEAKGAAQWGRPLASLSRALSLTLRTTKERIKKQREGGEGPMWMIRDKAGWYLMSRR